MTQQEKAMAQILQVSLFKLAEEYHSTIGRLKDSGLSSDTEIAELTKSVERMVDQTLEDYHANPSDFSMQSIERLHTKMQEAKQMLR